MTTPPDLVHTEPLPVKRLALGVLDDLSLKQLVAGDASAAVAYARGLAEALAGPERDDVRVQTLARLIGVARTEESLLNAMMMERLACAMPQDSRFSSEFCVPHRRGFCGCSTRIGSNPRNANACRLSSATPTA